MRARSPKLGEPRGLRPRSWPSSESNVHYRFCSRFWGVWQGSGAGESEREARGTETAKRKRRLLRCSNHERNGRTLPTSDIHIGLCVSVRVGRLRAGAASKDEARARRTRTHANPNGARRSQTQSSRRGTEPRAPESAVARPRRPRGARTGGDRMRLAGSDRGDIHLVTWIMQQHGTNCVSLRREPTRAAAGTWIASDSSPPKKRNNRIKLA